MKWLMLTLLLSGCQMTQQANLSRLQNKIDSAKEKLVIDQERIMKLEEELARKEISKIAAEIERIEKNSLTKEERLAFYTEQRKILSHIIEHNLSCSDRAQLVLDKILISITEMSDQVTE